MLKGLRIEKICKYCKKYYFILPSEDRRNRSYCNYVCFKKDHSINGKDIICKGCNKSFWFQKGKGGGGFWTRKYCSTKCMGIGYSRGDNPHIYKGEKIKRICKICKEIFEIKKYDYESKKDKGAGSFCSRGCRNKFYVMSDEAREKMSKKQLKRWQNKEFRKSQLECIRKGLMKQSTSIEKKVYDYLLLKGILFEKQKLINGRFLVDVYIPSLNLVIEADGIYWHSLPRIINKDRAENAYLKKCGYKLMRLTEAEINNGTFKERLVM